MSKNPKNFQFNKLVSELNQLRHYASEKKISRQNNLTSFNNLISDYIIRVVVVRGKWDDYTVLAADPTYSKYFTTSGIRKDKVDAFIRDKGVSFLAQYDGSLIPYFRSIDKKQTVFYLNIYALDFLNITVDSIASYISLKLQKRYSLNWILRPILKDLSIKVKQKNFLGYKIVCSGRFTRKQIATYMWMRNGSLKLNNISNLIKYSETRVRLKYGLCGVKVWLNFGQNNLNLKKRSLMLVYPLYTPWQWKPLDNGDHYRNCRSKSVRQNYIQINAGEFY